jgi:hypothetical protein
MYKKQSRAKEKFVSYNFFQEKMEKYVKIKNISTEFIE